MAQIHIFSLILIVISVNSQQYGYPYQTGYQYPVSQPENTIYQYPINQPDNAIYQYPIQRTNQPENSISWYPQVIQPPNQKIGYGYEQIPINYYPQSQNYPYNNLHYYPVQQTKVNDEPKQQKQDQQKMEPINLPVDPKTSDKYANVPTEIIDVDPENFNRIMQRLHGQPRIVSYETRVRKTKLRQPQYKVITETKKSNNTNAPQSIQRHEIINKSYSFNKTYVLHPGNDRKEVINLNFVNGVQVTDSPENYEDGADEAATVSTTTEITTTTTESEEPAAIDSFLHFK